MVFSDEVRVLVSSKTTLTDYNMHVPANNNIRLPFPAMPYTDMAIAYLKARTTLYLCGSRYGTLTDECFRLRIGSQVYEPVRLSSCIKCCGLNLGVRSPL